MWFAPAQPSSIHDFAVEDLDYRAVLVAPWLIVREVPPILGQIIQGGELVPPALAQRERVLHRGRSGGARGARQDA